MISRDTLTKIFLKQWGKSTDEANLKIYSRKWWQSSRVSKQSAFRLSEEGLDFLTNTLDLEKYDIEFNDPISLSPQTIIFLEKYLDCPYFLSNSSIIVFSDRRAFELRLFADDIQKFGLIKAMNERSNHL